jgi:hypothetical protein
MWHSPQRSQIRTNKSVNRHSPCSQRGIDGRFNCLHFQGRGVRQARNKQRQFCLFVACFFLVSRLSTFRPGIQRQRVTSIRQFPSHCTAYLPSVITAADMFISVMFYPYRNGYCPPALGWSTGCNSGGVSLPWVGITNSMEPSTTREATRC